MCVCVCVCRRLQDKVLGMYREALAMYADAKVKQPDRGPELVLEVAKVKALLYSLESGVN